MDLPRHLEAHRALWLRATDTPFLKGQAGSSVFGRGQTYAQGGAVQALATSLENDDLRAQATISGTQDYAVQWRISREGAVTAGCDCPHAQDGYFCKHQGALGLTLHALLSGDAPATDGAAQKKIAAAAKRAQTQAANRQALRDFLSRQSAQTLAERLWQWAERDRALMADVKAWAAVDGAATAGGEPSALKPVINQLLAHGGFIDYHEASDYARRARSVVTLLQGAAQRDPVAVRALCEHALKRLWKAIEVADDSDGAIGDVTVQVFEVLKSAVAAEHPPGEWAKTWFTLLEADPFGLWPDDALVDVAGPAFQRAWGQRVTDEWLAYAARTEAGSAAKRRGASEWDYRRSQLRDRYIAHLKRQGDAQAVLEALQAHLREAHEYSELVAYLESLGKHREALQRARQGHQRFPDDGRMEADLLRCYERDGWDEEALAIRRRQLENSPSVEHYAAVLRAAQAAGRDVAAYRQELLDWAIQRELVERKQRQRWTPDSPLDVSTRLRWLLYEDRLDDAVALARPPHASTASLLHELALQLPEARRDDALALLRRVFDARMARANSPYAEELQVVREMLARQTPEQRRQWLAHLRVAYKAKRNFIKGLDAPEPNQT
ncbi:MAG: hypothetical protein Q4G70_04780 [Pseudomonadota bacterium]|nr:hypothetical protein [Pseudomonadota bacterium]